MKMDTVQLFLCLIFSMTFGIEGDQLRCHSHSSKPGLHFDGYPGPATLAIGCIGEWLDLVCCTSGFKAILWEQTRDGGKIWTEFLTHKTRASRTLSEDGQVASIFSVDTTTDSGSYRCTAFGKSSQERIQNIVQLEIRNCSSWSGPPLPIEPKINKTELEFALLDNINISCMTFMGTKCDKVEFSCLSGWNKLGFNETDFTPLPEGNSTVRVRVINTYWPKVLMFESILSISRLREDDYGSYSCWALNSITYTDFDRTVIIKQCTPQSGVLQLTSAFVGMALLVILLIGFITIRRTRADLDVRIWWRRRQRKNSQPMNTVDFDVTVLHSKNEQFAMYLKRKLQSKLRFNVFSEDNVDPGQPLIASLLEAAERSRRFLVVMTPELIEDPNLVLILNNTISDCIPVFVFYSLDDSLLLNAERSIQGAIAVSPPLHWPGRVLTEEADAAEGYTYTCFDDTQPAYEQFWERLESRRVRIFWKKLLLRL